MEPETAIRHKAVPLTGRAADFDVLLERIGNRRFVLIGEASHGTHEFYETRAALTRRLIEEKGFHAVCIEGDWPDAHRAHRWVTGSSEDPDARESLSGFNRFPRWMWRNTVVEEFLRWLRNHNARSSSPTGFYGIDLYSLNASREAVVRYLDRVDPEAGHRARQRYGCFDHFGDPESYGYEAYMDREDSCTEEVLAQLLDMQRRAGQYRSMDGRVAEDEFFAAEQNARLIKNAEEYYRSMWGGRVSSWNLRDRHMTETIESLARHLDSRVGRSKLVVWEHNSHVGDARATEMSKWGEWNVGQLMRERFPGDTYIVGFSTWSGTVMAADDWGADGRVKRVREGMPGSYETLFHHVGMPAFILPLEAILFPHELIQRAVGVVYRPETERQSHYFRSRIAEQFDAVIHVDQTRALDPIDRAVPQRDHEVPETYPTGV